MHRYTKEQKEFIGYICDGLTVDEILEKFIERFGVNVTKKSIKGIMYRNNFKNHMQGFQTRFNKEHEPWNKGKKGIQTGGESGWFKKGAKPPSYKPVGSESIHEGYVWVKVADTNEWIKKHYLIWSEAYGSIPEGYVLRFADGNRLNVTLDNLFLTSRRVMTSVVKRGMDYDDPELRRTAHNLAELELAIKDIKTELRERQ